MSEQSKVVAELIRGLKHERDELKLQMHLGQQDVKEEMPRLDDQLNNLDGERKAHNNVSCFIGAA